VDSLKEKRRIVKSLLVRLRNDFNISAAEVADNDRHRTATIGVAVVSNDSSFGHRVASKVVNKIESVPEVVLSDYHTETY
jgi:hypothetical protein